MTKEFDHQLRGGEPRPELKRTGWEVLGHPLTTHAYSTTMAVVVKRSVSEDTCRECEEPPVKIRFACPDPECSKTYASRGGLKQHTDKHHSKLGANPKYQCGFCDKNHANSSNLVRHLLSCKKNPYHKLIEGAFVCEECAKEGKHKTFKQKGNLKTHCMRHHT